MKSEHIYLRPLEPEDIDFLYQWENDPDVWKVSNTITPYSKFILKQYIETSHLSIFETKQIRFIIVLSDTNRPIGTIDLFDFDPYNRRAGIGILIYDKENRQRGYASEALKLIIEYGFKTLDLHQLYCNVNPKNKASMRLFTNHGFIPVGIKKEWVRIQNHWQDEILLQLVQ